MPDRTVDRRAHQCSGRKIKRSDAIGDAQDALRHHVVGGDPVGKNDGRLFRSRQRVMENQIDKGNHGNSVAHVALPQAPASELVVDADTADVDEIPERKV